MITNAQKNAVAKYKKKVYEQIQLNLRKGKKDIIKEYALKAGFSINNYINIAIDRQLEKDGYKPIKESKEEQ